MQSCRFQLTDAALTELLKLIHTLIPKPNCCLKSVYTLRKFFAGMFSHIQTERHRFCTYCHSLLKQVNDGAYHFCHGEDNVGEFVTANVETQLKEKFKGVFMVVHVYTWSYIRITIEFTNKLL